MLGVAIPIAIHLWNVQQGKILKVGSTALLTKDAVKTTSRIKLHDLLLLLLRCLFIILLSLLLAQPRWQGNTNKQQGWVLIDMNGGQQAYAHYKRQADSLLSAGYELRFFNPGFAKADVKQLDSTGKDTVETNYWATLQQLTHTAGSERPLYIFTNAYIKNVSGNRPAATPNVHWYSYNPADTATYTAGTYATQGDSAIVITAHTSSAGIYNTYNIAAHNSNADTSTLNLTIYTKNYITDAGYVKAAVEAIKQFTRRKIVITPVSSAAQIPAQQQWLFWLADEVVPANIKAQNILVYADGKAENVQTWLASKTNETSNYMPVSLHKRIAATGTTDSAIWIDGYGNSLLAKNNKGQYIFYSHFNAAWNELPWSSEFPQMMYALLLPNDNETLFASDKRVLDDKQLQPQVSTLKAGTQPTTGTDASPLFWLLAFIIFFVERIIALRAKKERVYA